MWLLIVEDEKLMQEVIIDYFGSKDWEVVAVDNGEEALVLQKQELNNGLTLSIRNSEDGIIAEIVKK